MSSHLLYIAENLGRTETTFSDGIVGEGALETEGAVETLPASEMEDSYMERLRPSFGNVSSVPRGNMEVHYFRTFDPALLLTTDTARTLRSLSLLANRLPGALLLLVSSATCCSPSRRLASSSVL
jgi:hypothetical protein